MITITLDEQEFQQAALSGVLREASARRRRAANCHGASVEADPWHMHINGSLAELAVAKYLNCYWRGLGIYGTHGDLAGVEVRWRGQATYDLVLYPRDEDRVPYVLVTGDAPTLTLRGWILGVHGKRPEYWRAPGGRWAYFVPQSALCEMANLKPFLLAREANGVIT